MMKIKIKEKKKNSEESEYPCLKEGTMNEGLIVLFSEKGKGMVIIEDFKKCHKLGDSSRSWAMDLFIPFNKKIVLSND